MDIKKLLLIGILFLPLIAQARSPMNDEIKLSKIEIGLINGALTAARAGDITAPFGAVVAGDNTYRSYEVGLQTKFYLGPLNELRGFVYANAVGIVDYEHYIIDQPLFIFPNNSSVVLKTNYVARLGIGLETDPFLFFTGSVGAGLAVLNQDMRTRISQFTPITSARSRTSLAPTILLALNYHFCNQCLANHPLIASFEFNTEQYPSINNNTPSFLGTYRTTLRAAWVYHWDIILSTGF